MCTKYRDYNEVTKVCVSCVVHLSPEGVGCSACIVIWSSIVSASMTTSLIREIVWQCYRNVSSLLVNSEDLSRHVRDIEIGTGSKVDSMALLSLLIQVEESLSARGIAELDLLSDGKVERLLENGGTLEGLASLIERMVAVKDSR